MKKGFTLIELMVVIAVIAILATIALFGLAKAQAAARDTSRQQIMNGVRTALERYFADNQAYYSATNDFCGAIFALVGGGYLTQPVDPSDKTNICSAATDGNRYKNGAMYVYISTASGGVYNSYMLKLAKESGGYSHFYSPQ